MVESKTKHNLNYVN